MDRDSLERFRQTAEAALEPIHVTPELRARTLEAVRRASRRRTRLRLAIPAAGFAAIAAAFLFWNAVGPAGDPAPGSIPSGMTPITMMTPEGTGPSVDSPLAGSDPATTLDERLAQSRALLGDGYRLPSYVPDGYALSAVELPPSDGKSPRSVRFVYASSAGKSYSVKVSAAESPSLPTESGVPITMGVPNPAGAGETAWSYDRWEYRLGGDLPEEQVRRIVESTRAEQP
jgi:hypothetical protein